MELTPEAWPPEGVSENHDGSLTIVLKNPIRIGDLETKTLTMKRLTARHLRDVPLNNMNMGHLLDAAGRATGLTKVEVDQVAGEDVTTLIACVGKFLAPGRVTGKSS